MLVEGLGRQTVEALGLRVEGGSEVSRQAAAGGRFVRIVVQDWALGAMVTESLGRREGKSLPPAS